MQYFIFINYLIRHKWHVFIECCRYGVPWRGICHDMSKFLPDEFIAYANQYHANHINSQRIIDPVDLETSPYYSAWLIHQKRNPHHWQWWILHGKGGHAHVIPMPEKYIKEMVADWRGAGRAQGQPDTLAWYQAHKDKMMLHVSTRIKVEQLLHFNKIIDSEYMRGNVTGVNSLNMKTANNVN